MDIPKFLKSLSFSSKLGTSATVIIAVLLVTAAFGSFIQFGATATAATASTSSEQVYTESFEDEPADTGFPEGWINESNTNPDVVEVTTAKSIDGNQSFHAKENGSGYIKTHRDDQPYSNYQTGNTSVSFYKTTFNGDGDAGASDGPVISLKEDGTEIIHVGVGEAGDLYYINGSGDRVEIDTTTSEGEWINIEVFDVDPANDTFSVTWSSPSSSGTKTGLGQPSKINNGYNQLDLRVDEEAYIDDISGPKADRISGRVVTQDGVPVRNATVKVVKTNHTKFKELEGSRDAALEAANDALTRADAAKPPQLQSFSTAVEHKGWNEVLSGEETYAVAHTKSDWDNNVGSVDTGGIGAVVWGADSSEEATVSVDNPKLGSPIIDAPADEPVVLSTWNPDKESLLQDQVDGDLPGVTTSEDIIVRQLGPGGSYRGNNFTAETKEYAKTGYKAHKAATVKLAPGVYEITPKNGGTSTYVVAGNYGKVISGWVEDGKDQQGQALERAKWIDQQIQDGKFIPGTVTTNSTGHFSMNVGSNVERVGLIAYKKPDQMTSVDPKNATRNDIREWYNNTNSYNGSVYAPTSMELVTVGTDSEGVTLETMEVSAPAYTDTNRVNDAWEWFMNFLDDHTPAEAISAVQQRLEDLSDSELREHYLEMYQMAKEKQNLVNQNDDLLNETEVQNATIQELRNDTRQLEQRLQEVENSVEAADGSSEIQNQMLSATQQFETALDPENVQVLVHYTNGTSETVPTSSEYVSVEDNLLGGSTIHLKDYPIGDAPAATAHFRVVTKEGMGEARQNARNPSFSGDIPELDAVDLTSLSPGPGETVRVRAHPSATTGFGTVEDVTVYGPSGQKLNTSMTDAEEAEFKTNGEGVHHVALTYSNLNGKNFTTTFRVPAADENRNMPASVRVKQSPIGTYALTGDKLSGGEASVSDGGATVSIAGRIGHDASVPGTIHVYTHGLSLAPDSKTQVSVLKGKDSETVSKNVRVVIHTPELSESALVYRHGTDGLVFDRAAIGDGSQYGSVEKRPQNATIRTYTNENGRVTVQTIESPGFIERQRHRINGIAQSLPDLSLPSIGMMAPDPTGTVAPLAG